MRKVLLYAVVIYSAVTFVIGIPTFLMGMKGHHKFKWESVETFEDSGPKPIPQQPPSDKQMGLSQPDPSEISSSCKRWSDPVAVSSKPSTMMFSMSRMHLTFPLVNEIALRLNLSSDELKGYVAGSLTVDMNPDKTVSNPVFTANARSSNAQVFMASTVCRTQFRNTTEIMIRIPERADNSTDTIQMDLQYLLPWTSTPTDLGVFVSNLPMFKQLLGDLSQVSFQHFKIVDPSSPITAGSISAESLFVQTSGAEISGNFTASKKLFLDNINGGVFANISLHSTNSMKTRLSVETGNGPIVAHVKLALDDNIPQVGPKKHRNFFTKFRTFNAPMNISISHAKNLKPGRLWLMAENVLGPMDVSLDSQYTGTFDVRAKASTVQVLQPSASNNLTSSSARSGTDSDDDDGDDDDGDDQGHELHFVELSQERTRGWIGDDRKPEEFDRKSLGRVELINSLSPITLHLPMFFQPPTGIRR